MIKVREAIEDDAVALIELRRSLLRETEFLLLEPAEYAPTVETEVSFINGFQALKNSAVFIAVDDNGDFVGFVGLAGGTTNRTKHRANLFIGVLKQQWGMGVGRLLMDKLIAWSNESELLRIELTTDTNNHRAVALYKKMGFEIEGIKLSNIMLGDRCVDEYSMFYLIQKNA
jgi:RimJ/RimL family protein N-acetyltransferase